MMIVVILASMACAVGGQLSLKYGMNRVGRVSRSSESIDLRAGTGGVLAGLAFFWEGSDALREYYSDSAANSNPLPSYVDVYLEILNERDAKRVVEMQGRGIDPDEYIERNVRRYTTRVHFQNRNGYRPR